MSIASALGVSLPTVLVLITCTMLLVVAAILFFEKKEAPTTTKASATSTSAASTKESTKTAKPQPEVIDIENVISLIPDTLDEMERTGVGSKVPTVAEKKAKRRDLESKGFTNFNATLRSHNIPLKRVSTSVFQMNIGLYCNQACTHCHVDSSPRRTEMMDRKTADKCLEIIRNSPSVQTVDLTGGAPELNTEFRHLVIEARKMGKVVIDRCNLTVLLEPGQEDLVKFLVDNQVRVVASLPCYTADNVDKQRGPNVFSRSIRGLQMLNDAGYGKPENPHLPLDLIYNPGGPFLPPAQSPLEADYKKELESEYGIVFSNLFTITNMPINRYVDALVRDKKLEHYMHLIINAFNPHAVEGLMCRTHVSVRWDGRLYDCDFNQQIELDIGDEALSVFDIKSCDEFLTKRIATGVHCFGCTAGAGSSCQGALVTEDAKEKKVEEKKAEQVASGGVRARKHIPIQVENTL